jgi:hypothetical protein
MRPAGRQRSEVVPITPNARVAAQSPYTAASLLEKATHDISSTNQDEVVLGAADRSAAHLVTIDHRGERLRQLATSIEQRIKSRLAGRIRQLLVRVNGDTIVIEGRCSTYYTKQLAQHAALGILEDELLENAIVVGI